MAGLCIGSGLGNKIDKKDKYKNIREHTGLCGAHISPPWPAVNGVRGFEEHSAGGRIMRSVEMGKYENAEGYEKK